MSVAQFYRFTKVSHLYVFFHRRGGGVRHLEYNFSPHLSRVVSDVNDEPPRGTTTLAHAQIALLHGVEHLLAQGVLDHVPVLCLPPSKG